MPPSELERSKERLDRLDFYPRPVSIRGVQVFTVPRLFRLPGMRRYDGYALPWTILLRDRPEVEELSGQRWVPVLVHGDQVIHDSHRILEYLDWEERTA